MSGPDASLIVRCDCSDLGHLIVFDAWHWENESPPHSELYCHLELETHLPWWRRCLLAIRYALTGKTQKWFWTDVVLTNQGAAELRDFLSEFLEASLNGPRSGD